MKTHLHFTFGPVQGFVAQARRTRDLYAGSLLLSHLALAAMKAVRGTGEIILPDFDAVSKAAAGSEHATAPNRFIAKFNSRDAAAAAGRSATKALRDQWREIGSAVWSRYLEKHTPLGRDTAAIWQRQVEHFWNIAWVVGDAGQTDLLDRRKNWQTHFPPEEGGDHCVLMGQWQEISGYIRSQQRRRQDDFWKAVSGDVNKLDLEPGERLCAIAFIKRFFPSVAQKTIGRMFDTRGWPSTVTIAALPWVRKLATATSNVLANANAYADLAKDEPGALVASAHRIKLLHEFPTGGGSFANLSGNFLNRTALVNADDTPLQNEHERTSLLAKLRELEGLKDADNRRLGSASNFYALLLMDGDSMGALIRDFGPEKVTVALTQFAIKVPSVVENYDGVTIYAGGDDLLALLPLDRALDAACAAHAQYAEAFGSGIAATVSAAIVFAHYRCTFSRVLASAHDLLDDVAKDKTGRDAIALRVLKPGGVTGEWSAPFDYFMKTTPHVFAPLFARFNNGTLSASLLYNLRERFTELTEDETAPFQREQLLKLFAAEALIGKRDREDFAWLRKETGVAMGELLDICETVRRNPDTKATKHTGVFGFDGPRLIKFLALDGREGAE